MYNAQDRNIEKAENKGRLKAVFMPIIIIQIYLFLTILLYNIWIIKWNIPSPSKLTIYVIINFLALFLGYVLYAMRAKRKLTQEHIIGNEIGELTKNQAKIFNLSSLFNIIASIVLAYYFMGGISIAHITSPGVTYNYRLTEFSAGRNIFVQFFTYSWVISYFYYPMGILYWSKLKPKQKLLFTVSTSMTIIYWLNMGTMKGLGDLVILCIPALLFKIYVYSTKVKEDGIVRKRGIKRKSILFLLIIGLFVTIFSVAAASRKDEFGLKTNQVVYITQAQMPFIASIDYNNFFLGLLGTNIANKVNDLVSYTTQGYTGLAYSMELPFQWTYGFGSSRTLSTYAERFLGVQINNNTYLARNEYINDWPNGMFWSTVFPWIASDVSFYGVPFFMFFMGMLIAYCWFDFIKTKNIVALVAFCQLFIFAFFIPANNQLVQSYQSFYGTVALFGWYFLSKFVRIKFR